MTKRFEDLEVFQLARELSKDVYAITETPPFKYDTRFVQQIHASAGSVMDNIAEGYERDGNKEFVNFLYIAKGSCGEVRSQIIRSKDCGFINEETYDRLYIKCVQLSVKLSNFITEVRTSEYKGRKYSK